jgi:hypothetical protein
MWLVMAISMNIGIYSKTFDGTHENVNHWYWPQWKNSKIVSFKIYYHSPLMNTKCQQTLKEVAGEWGEKDSTVHNHSHADSILRRNNSGYKILYSNSVNLSHAKSVL